MYIYTINFDATVDWERLKFADEDYILQDNETDVQINESFHKAIFDFETQTWSEGLTQEEIDELNNQPQEPTEIELIQKQVSDTQLALIESYEATLKAQDDNTNTNLALTDVYEIILEQQSKIEELSNKVTELESKQ
jgi:hypothetical protein